MKTTLILCLLFLFNLTIGFGQKYPSPELFLSQLIQIESYSGCEVEAVRDVMEWGIHNGFHVTDFNMEGDSKNVLLSLYPLSSRKPNIVFSSHLDVLTANNLEEWKHNPFGGEIIEDTIWGRGAIDCKGLAVMQLYGMKQFKDSLKDTEFPYNISFLGLAEEETSSKNGAELISSLFMDSINPVVIFGEGGAGLTKVLKSDPEAPIFGMSVADKSSLWLKLTAEGGGFGHGAIPTDLYANKRLIKGLIRLLDEKKSVKFNPLVMNMFRELGDLEKGMRKFVLKRINWSIFWPLVKSNFAEDQPFNVILDNTFSITNIQSSATVANEMSQKASAVLDCRLLPGTDVDKFLKEMKRTLGNRISIQILLAGPSAEPSKASNFFNMMSESIQVVHPNAHTIPILFPASTDNNYFRRKGIPVYGIIPSVLDTKLFETVHSSNERIGIDNLHKGIAVYYDFLKRCQKTFVEVKL
jgi:carboxypeptidase PM20D1